mmetsp:Transcript_16153/g.48845  ORF Transcript_16153/g.48845 Transcript_16153/m.48845 type:complete len:262 (-) Transcript_16153:286-1071(-)
MKEGARPFSQTPSSGTRPHRSKLELAIHEEGEEGFLGVESVFGLVEDDGLGAVDDGGGLFFAAHGWEAVHEGGVGFGEGHEVVGDLEGQEGRKALGLVGFRGAVGHPGVGVDDVGAVDGLFRSRAHDRQLAQDGALPQDFRFHGILLERPADADFEAHDRAGAREVVGDVVLDVADEGERDVPQFRDVARALAFADRQKIGQHLHRVREVVQRVHHGYPGRPGEAADLGSGLDAGGDSLRHARQHFSRVLVRLLRAQRRVS